MEPEFQIVRHLSAELNKTAIERAVKKFVKETAMDVDPVGFYNQTLQRIAAATFLNQPGQDFWLAHAYGEVVGYALASYQTDLDMRLCYWVAQSWVDPEWRGHSIVKNSWAAIRAHAEKSLCAHLVVVSSRNVDAHCRWLGGEMKPYATILKESLGAAIKTEDKSNGCNLHTLTKNTAA